MTLGTDVDPSVDLLDTGRAPRSLPLSARERLTEGVIGGAFLAAALAIALGFDAARDWSIGPAVVLVVLFAIAANVELEVGAGYAVPTQLVFVPMLLLLPTPWVPLLVAAGWILAKVPDIARGRVHPGRAVLSLANSWFAVGPALVLVVGEAQAPDWGDWPVYLGALAAQFVFDLAAGEVREWLGRGVAPQLQLQVIGWVVGVDILLSPLGLLAAFASERDEYAFLLLVPPAAMLIAYARERTGRLDSVLALRDQERAATRSREDLIAGASHEMLTPLAVLGGLIGRLGSDAVAGDPARRAKVQTAMAREHAQLRQLARQFVDYTRLKAGRELNLAPQPTDVTEIAASVAAAYDGHATVRIDAEPGLPAALVDADRLEQMLMALVSNAVKFSPHGAPVVVRAATAGDRVELTVVDEGRGIPEADLPTLFEELRRGSASAGIEGSGIGLYVCRMLAEAQGGDIRVASREGEGSRFTLSLPARSEP